MMNATKGAAWPTAGGANNRCGIAPGSVNISGTLVQQLEVGGVVQASPLIDGAGNVYVVDLTGSLKCFSPANTTLWRTMLSGSVSATPAFHSDQPRMYVGTHSGWLYALEIETGRAVWKDAVPTQGDPRILSDLLFVPGAKVVVGSSWGGKFFARDADSGKERYSWDAGISPSSAASADAAGRIYCVRAVAGKGTELVQVTLGEEPRVVDAKAESNRGARRAVTGAAPVLDETRQVVYWIANGDRTSELRACSLESLKPLWQHPLPAVVQATPTILKNGVVIVSDLAGNVHAVSPSGTVAYHYNSGAEYLLAGGLADAMGFFVFGDPLGQVHLVDAQGKGSIITELPRSIQARPAAGPGNAVFIPASDRVVYLFRGA